MTKETNPVPKPLTKAQTQKIEKGGGKIFRMRSGEAFADRIARRAYRRDARKKVATG